MKSSMLKIAFGAFLLFTFVEAAPQLNNQTAAVACLTKANVPYAVNTSANWTTLSTPYNLRLIYTPAVITIPEDEKDVSESVTCAASSGLKVQARGGGHSYASYSSGGQNGSLIIEMEKFSEITVNSTTFVAKIGAGQRLGNIAQALYNQGKRALPHGTCAGVGVAGHALHGGYGYDSRKWGITLDHIVALDVVLANGTIVHTTNTSYPDIFFAMRGAGDAFGIVTYFYFATEPAPSSVILFQVDLSSALNDLDVATQAFLNVQTFVLTSALLTPNITFGFYTDSGGSLSVTGWCMDCNLNAVKDDVLPKMLNGFPYTADQVTVKTQQWIPALQNLAGSQNLTQPLGSAYVDNDTFYAKSLVTKNEFPLTTEAIRSFWSYIISNQDSVSPFYSIINLYGGPGSAINQRSRNSSAYSDRDALWVFQNYGYTADNLPPFDPNLFALVDGLNDAVTLAQADGNFTMYLNYVDPNLSPLDAAVEYYGAETYDKLLGIKVEVDPLFVFWNPQAVGTTHAF